MRFVDLNSVKAEPVDNLGRPNAITDDQLTRIAGDPGNWPRSLACRQLPSARWHDAALRVEPARPAVPEQLEPMSWRADRSGFTTGGISKPIVRDFFHERSGGRIHRNCAPGPLIRILHGRNRNPSLPNFSTQKSPVAERDADREKHHNRNHDR